jgi:hypothetical protein
MGWQASQYPSNELRFKPYVYRGIGVDIYEEPKVKPGPKPKPPSPHSGASTVSRNARRRKARPKATPKPRPPAKPKPPKKTPEELAEIRRLANIKARDTRLRKKTEREAWQAEQRAKRAAEQAAARAAAPRPAKGWQPIKGDEIDALLAELEED